MRLELRRALEQQIVKASADAVSHIVGRLKKHWPAEYEDTSKLAYPAVREIVESTLQFEIACCLQEEVEDRHYVSWEEKYCPDYPARVDLVVEERNGKLNGVRSRTAIELKWIYSGQRGLDWLASDALKLAWCEAGERYVLGIGDRPVKCLPADLRAKAVERVRWREDQDRKRSIANLSACPLVDCAEVEGVTVALFRAEHLRLLD